MDSEKAGLKLNIQNTKIVASGPITSGQIDGETMGTVKDFIFLGSKITAAMKLKDAQTSSFQNHKRINSRVLSHYSCGSLLQEP